LLDTETNEGQATSLARAQILLGDYRKAASELQQIRDVSASDIVRAMRTYIKDIQLVIVGDTTRIKRDWAKM
jgi:predicted Zn-dependent peptidase